MIKSYQAPPASIKKESPQLEVKDYMTKKLVTLRPEQNITEAIDILLSKKISGAPVVDESGRLLGVLSEGDCLKELVKGQYNNSLQKSSLVADLMTSTVITIEAGLSIFQAAERFLNLKVRRFPVLEEGKLVGQISQKDLMRAFLKLKKA